MRPSRKVWMGAALVALLGVSLISQMATGAPASSGVAIIVNPSNPLNNLTLPELRKIYRGERQYWTGNIPVMLLMRTPGAREREVILRVVFEMSEERYTQYWVAKVMRADVSDPPAALYSHGIMQEGVRGNAGAIGYVAIGDVREGVKVLRVNGVLPSEAGYAVR